jgi:hypothetical protein
MANPEHLKILKQGVDVWNKWRIKNVLDILPDLSNSDLSFLNLTRADLSFTNLSESNLQESILDHAYLGNANLAGANLNRASLEKANLYSANAIDANFEQAVLFGADFLHANFQNSKFKKANLNFSSFSSSLLEFADLRQTQMRNTLINYSRLVKTNFAGCTLDRTIFAECDLSEASGLEQVEHERSSTIGIDTIYQSSGKIPEVFLRGCGVPEDFITYAKSLTTNPIEYYSCFISFTEKDDAFSERLYNDMQAKGIRCWRWKEDAKWGRTLRKEIDEAVRYYDKLVVICSKESLRAPAVLEEIERALDKEDMQKRAGDEGEVLFPITIDRYIFDEWEHELKIRLMRKTIGNFYDHGSDLGKYRKSVERLVRDLNRPRTEKK